MCEAAEVFVAACVNVRVSLKKNIMSVRALEQLLARGHCNCLGKTGREEELKWHWGGTNIGEGQIKHWGGTN